MAAAALPSPVAQDGNRADGYFRGSYILKMCRLEEAGTSPNEQYEAPPIAMAAELVNNQADCMLLQKFPVEIRKQILGQAFGSRVVHIVHWREWKTEILHWAGGECKNPVLHRVSCILSFLFPDFPCLY